MTRANGLRVRSVRLVSRPPASVRALPLAYRCSRLLHGPMSWGHWRHWRHVHRMPDRMNASPRPVNRKPSSQPETVQSTVQCQTGWLPLVATPRLQPLWARRRAPIVHGQACNAREATPSESHHLSHATLVPVSGKGQKVALVAKQSSSLRHPAASVAIQAPPPPHKCRDAAHLLGRRADWAAARLRQPRRPPHASWRGALCLAPDSATMAASSRRPPACCI